MSHPTRSQPQRTRARAPGHRPAAPTSAERSNRDEPPGSSPPLALPSAPPPARRHAAPAPPAPPLPVEGNPFAEAPWAPSRDDGPAADLPPPIPAIDAILAAAAAARPGPAADAPPYVAPGEFVASFGEPIERTLDLDTWTGGLDMATALDRLEAEVARAVDAEDNLRERTRQLVFPHLGQQLPGGGVWDVTRAQLEHAQRTILLSGAIEAVDALCAVHDTLPLTVAQIGVCLTGYGGPNAPGVGTGGAGGDRGVATWGHRLYRRELRVDAGDPVQEALAILERRDVRADLYGQGRRDLMSHLLRRGILSHAQRAVLLHKSDRPWRMGRGQPAPHELLTGSGNMELLHAALDVLRGLVLNHKRFLFVPGDPGERFLLTVGNALKPAQFAIVETAERRMEPLVQEGHLIGRHYRAARDFLEDAAPRIVCGVYRTYADTPPQVFYAHRDHAEEGAVIAMADSLLQPHRTFPALLHLAATVCEEVFGADGFNATVQAAYAGRGCPLRYVSERQTKR